MKSGRRAGAWLAVVAAAGLTACGGGGGGGGGGLPFLPAAPAPAPAPAPAGEQSSAPCINEADFRVGTKLALRALPEGAAAETGTAFRRETTTEAREAIGNTTSATFNLGAETTRNPFNLNSQTYTYVHTETRKEYRDLVDGQVVMYGDRIHTQADWENGQNPFPLPAVIDSSVLRTFKPPISFPVAMQPGAVVTRQVVRTESYFDKDGKPLPMPPGYETYTGPAHQGHFVLTYHGRESVVTPLGTYDACKFTMKITSDRGGYGTPLASTQIQWLAASGPYRGQILKQSRNGASWVAHTLTYSPAN